MSIIERKHIGHKKGIIKPSSGENSVLYDPQGVITNKAYEEQGKLRCGNF